VAQALADRSSARKSNRRGPVEVVILCGGKGVRLREYTQHIPKPMVKIGDHPIVWHIMCMYAALGFTRFTLCLGYKAHVFRRYFERNCDNFRAPRRDAVHGNDAGDCVRTAEGWRVRMVDTGLDTMTGGRVKRIEPYLDEDPFFVTYGDCLSDVDLRGLVSAHQAGGRIGTVTVVKPPPRFGVVQLEGDRVVAFAEKPPEERWINGGFFVFDRRVFCYLNGDGDVLEKEPLMRLASSEQLTAYRHDGFWQPMDTPTEVMTLNDLWRLGDPPWSTEIPALSRDRRARYPRPSEELT
jgi:glucose-1-phosphate cytidylyltransferase